MILRRNIGLVVCATIGILALPAFSQPGAGVQGGPAGSVPGGGGPGFDKLQGKLALTADQQKQLEDLSTQLFGQLREKMPTLQQKRMEIMKGLTEPKIDATKLTTLQADLNNTSNAVADAILQNQIKQMQVLTPDQRAQLKPPEGEVKMPPMPAQK